MSANVAMLRSAGRRAGLPGYSFDLLPLWLDRFGSRLSIAVIFAGDSGEPDSVLHRTHNPRSWKSYEAVATDIGESLLRLGFRNVHLMPEDAELADRLRRHRIDIAWLNTGGVQGYDPMCHAPALLEMLGLPYVGHNPLNVSTLDNKHAFKRELISAGLPTAPFTVWNGARGPLMPEINSRFRLAFGDYQGPFAVKPVSGRASLHVHVVDRVHELQGVVEAVYRHTHNLVQIETYLPGREFCVSVCGPVVSCGRRLVRRDGPFAFSPNERVLEEGERIFTSMDVKPITHSRLRPVTATGEPELYSRLCALAREIHLEFACETLIRVDLREDEAGRLNVLEANPKPDLKHPEGERTCIVCSGLEAHGMDYDDLILSLLADRLDSLFAQRPSTVAHILGHLADRRAAASAAEDRPA